MRCVGTFCGSIIQCEFAFDIDTRGCSHTNQMTRWENGFHSSFILNITIHFNLGTRKSSRRRLCQMLCKQFYATVDMFVRSCVRMHRFLLETLTTSRGSAFKTKSFSALLSWDFSLAYSFGLLSDGVQYAQNFYIVKFIALLIHVRTLFGLCTLNTAHWTHFTWNMNWNVPFSILFEFNNYIESGNFK